jgi:hypothetical protein
MNWKVLSEVEETCAADVHISPEQELNMDSDTEKAYPDLGNDGRTNSMFSFGKGNMQQNVDKKQ